MSYTQNSDTQNSDTQNLTVNPSRSISHSPIYREFRAIEATEWRTVIRFYEEFEDVLPDLEFEEYFEMLLAYTKALFEVGDFDKHLELADKVIEVSMLNNIKFFNGEDVLQLTLFKKAASSFQLYEYEKCDYLLRELLRIDPFDTDSALFLKKCLRQINSSIVQKAKAASILLLLISAFIICLEVVVVRNFYPDQTAFVETLRNYSLLSSVLILIGGHLFHYIRCSREVDNFVGHLKKRKRKY